MDYDFMALMQQQKDLQELDHIVSCNENTREFGLSLTPEEARELVQCRNESLKACQRVEFGEGILDRLIWEFCDSPYLEVETYLLTLERLQNIFYEFKNESEDKVTDEELMTFMREQFDAVCFGDLEYLESTCLERFTRAVRAGYSGYMETGGSNQYQQFAQEKRWDSDLYLQALRELCWE